MSEDDVSDLITFLAENPTAGEVMSDTGGCRKVQVAGRGKGKSGGYRTVTFYTGESMPVFLLTVFGKGERSNLTKAERNQLKRITKLIVDEYKSRVSDIGAIKERVR
jgi:hypothetical protein